MNFTWIKWRVQLVENLEKCWYWLMKPIAFFFTQEKTDARYRKKEGKITKEMAIDTVAKGVAKYMVNHSAHYKKPATMHFIICEYMSEEDFGGYHHLDQLTAWRFFSKPKARMAYRKFRKDTEMQEAIIEKLRSFKGFVVEEEYQEWSYHYIENYKKTVHVTYSG